MRATLFTLILNHWPEKNWATVSGRLHICDANPGKWEFLLVPRVLGFFGVTSPKNKGPILVLIL